MKCTEIYNLNIALRTVALQELEQALKTQEKGEFKWEKYGPTVSVYGDGIYQVTVTHVWLEGGLHIVGWDSGAGEEVELDEFELVPMDIFFIIEQMDQAGDVSTPGVQDKINELTSYLKSL